jgi:PhnB protein
MKMEIYLMKQLNPYLRFNGTCKEAMTFYKDCLGGELTLTTVGESPMAEQMTEDKDKIMHSTLKKDNLTIMATDLSGPEGLTKGNMMVLCLNGTDKDEIKGYFEKLSAGGTIKTPLREEFFGLFGDFTDKFGVDWMVQAGEQM